MRVAVTGGTGFVGTHTVRALADAGHDVVAIARGSRRRPRRDRVTFVRADLTDSPALAEAFSGCDAVIHLVAVIREQKRQTFDAVNRAGTERVVDAAAQAGVPHLIHQSALGADPDPRYPYLQSKWSGEQAVRLGSVPWTVLRPSLIFGPGDGFFTVLTKVVRFNPVVPIAGDGSAMFQPIAIEDVTRCLVTALERGPDMTAHEIGGPDHLSYQEIVLTIKEAIGAHRMLTHVPVKMMMPLAFLMETFLRNPPVTRQQLQMLALNNITRLDSVRTAFGFDPARFADNADYLQDY